MPTGWFQWKEDLYEERGLKLGFSLQSVYQRTTDSLTGQDSAWGGWLLLESKWDAINRQQDWAGSLVAALDWRQEVGSNSAPALFVIDSGSAWATDAAHIPWDIWFASLYWEQRFREEDNTVVRFGTQVAGNFIDFCQRRPDHREAQQRSVVDRPSRWPIPY